MKTRGGRANNNTEPSSESDYLSYDFQDMAITCPTRPPRWEAKKSLALTPLDINKLKSQQFQTLNEFRRLSNAKRVTALHEMHFDWWMFPLDEGRYDEYLIRDQTDVDRLNSDEEWIAGYRESIQLVAIAWGNVC